MTDYAPLLRSFLDPDGKLKQFPAKRKMKIIALFYLAEKIEADRDYTEQEINEILLSWHTFHDPATLRREMYDYHLLDRTRDGRTYRKSNPQPDPDALL